MTSPRALTPSEAQPQLGDFLVVDVRGAHEYHGPLGRVPGAILLPLPELEARAEELPKGRALLLVCRSGVRSGKACDALAARGFGPVVNLTGGMIGWNNAGLPIDKTDPVSLAALVDGLVAWAAQVGARPQAAVRDELRTGLAGEALALDVPTRASVARAIELVEAALREKGAPPDLDLSVASYRRWLADL
jgi:rhodanese-related sulfurtransferase